ncbi:MAG TPA: hypothetical protein PL033_07325 [Candidatus Brocadiia bacterium]|nr:hypothetical protein [Candidatus Brocadiia bacterium]
MFPLKVRDVIITERVVSPESRTAADRILSMVEAQSVRRMDDAQLNDFLIQDFASRSSGRTGQSRNNQELILILNAFSWPSDEEARDKRARLPALGGIPMLMGQGAWTFRDAASLRRHSNGVCQSAFEVHCAYGCCHDCRYCHVGSHINLMLNMGELAGRLEAFMPRIPWQRLYKFDNYTDQICYEPELGASKTMVEFFAGQRDRYLLLYTRSDNIAHLLDLEHRGHTIINWSLSTGRQAALLEPAAPTPQARIEAMRRCAEAGYRVRVRLSPIVPLAGWEDDITELAATLLSRVSPDLITLDVVGWMTARQMSECMDIGSFAPDARKEVETLLETRPDTIRGKHLLSHELRTRIFERTLDAFRGIDPGVRLSICMETPEMWETMGERLGMKPGGQVCCCAPTSAPGHPMLRSH